MTGRGVGFRPGVMAGADSGGRTTSRSSEPKPAPAPGIARPTYRNSAHSSGDIATLTDTELATRYRELVRITDTAECGPELRDELEALATEYKERLRRRWAG